MHVGAVPLLFEPLGVKEAKDLGIYMEKDSTAFRRSATLQCVANLDAEIRETWCSQLGKQPRRGTPLIGQVCRSRVLSVSCDSQPVPGTAFCKPDPQTPARFVVEQRENGEVVSNPPALPLRERLPEFAENMAIQLPISVHVLFLAIARCHHRTLHWIHVFPPTGCMFVKNVLQVHAMVKSELDEGISLDARAFEGF